MENKYENKLKSDLWQNILSIIFSENYGSNHFHQDYNIF